MYVIKNKFLLLILLFANVWESKANEEKECNGEVRYFIGKRLR
jgi:hypothetical protein